MLNDGGNRLFISYSRRNKEQVYAFVDALIATGVDIWIDRQDIEALDDFPMRIRDGLAQCHALLAWYSPEYAKSSYCQKELTAAWICSQRLACNPTKRIFVVNPQDSVEHICLGDVGRQHYLAAPSDDNSKISCIRRIQAKLAELSDSFAAVHEFKAPQWYPNAPPGSTRFIGRIHELWEMHTALNPIGIFDHENANLIVQLRGMGGAGKSLLAIEYAKRFAAAYPGGIYWLRTFGFDPNKQKDLEAYARECRVQIENLAVLHDIPIGDKDLRELRRDLGRKLAVGGRYLWVVDDMPEALDQEKAFPDWCAPSANGCTVITTRCRDYEGLGATVIVGMLEPKPALELLTQERKPQTERDLWSAKCLAEDLGHHPLALDVAGHFLLKTMDFGSLRSEITRETSGIDPLGSVVAGLKGQLPGGHEKSIVATLLTSIRLLSEQGLNLLRLACELEVGIPIPKHLVLKVFSRVFFLRPHEAEKYVAFAVNQTEMHSLASISLGNIGAVTISIHSLVRYTMLHGDPDKDEAGVIRNNLRERAIYVLRVALKELDLDRHASFETEIAHARHLVPQPRNIEEILLSRSIGYFEGLRGNHREALSIATRDMSIFERVLGSDHPDTLANRANIAAWTAAVGQPNEAIRLDRELLLDWERALGAQHPGALKIRSNIAAWTAAIGKVDEALHLELALLPDFVRVLGPDDVETLITRRNIAAFTGKTGHPDEALRLFRELLKDQERILGHYHVHTLTTRSNIAGYTGETGDASEALRMFEDLLRDEERVMGLKHPYTLTVRRELADWTGKTGDASGALRLLGDLLSDQERFLGRNSLDALRTRVNIGYWTGKTGDANCALRLLGDLLLDQKRILGHDAPGTLDTRANIAYWTEETGDASGALQMLKELLPDEERVLGCNSPRTLTTRRNIGALMFRTGAADEALRLLRELLVDEEQLLGSDHQVTQQTRSDLVFLEREDR